MVIPFDIPPSVGVPGSKYPKTGGKRYTWRANGIIITYDFPQPYIDEEDVRSAVTVEYLKTFGTLPRRVIGMINESVEGRLSEDEVTELIKEFEKWAKNGKSNANGEARKIKPPMTPLSIYKAARDRTRTFLKTFGAVHLQQSVYFIPAPKGCETPECLTTIAVDILNSIKKIVRPYMIVLKRAQERVDKPIFHGYPNVMAMIVYPDEGAYGMHKVRFITTSFGPFNASGKVTKMDVIIKSAVDPVVVVREFMRILRRMRKIFGPYMAADPEVSELVKELARLVISGSEKEVRDVMKLIDEVMRLRAEKYDIVEALAKAVNTLETRGVKRIVEKIIKRIVDE